MMNKEIKRVRFFLERNGGLEEPQTDVRVPIKEFVTESRLSDLALLVDTGGLYSAKGAGLEFVKSVENAMARDKRAQNML